MNNKTLIIGVVAVAIVVVVGGAVAFRHQIKSMVMPGSNEAMEESTTETAAPGNSTAETDAMMMQNNAPKDAMTAQMIEVNYDGSQFTPASVTVKKGQMVKFVNNSDGAMSVASDPHPTHTIYPEFDQYKTDQKGQKEFTFTFDKVGSWGYHNHMNPSATGTVVVTE